MLGSILRAYRDSARIAIALPLLFALPAGAELVQHVIEYRIGLFDSLAAMRAAGDHPARIGFGQVKILSLVALLYWVARWQMFRDDPARRVLGDARSAFLFAFVLLFGIALGAVQQFGGGWIAPLIDGRALVGIGIAFFAATTALEVYLSGWKVGAALGNRRLGFLASFRLIHGNFWWSLGFTIAMVLPLMILHYLLNGLAVGRPDALLWAMLALDALVVGYLGLAMATTVFLIALRAAERSDTPLAPGGDEPLPA